MTATTDTRPARLDWLDEDWSCPDFPPTDWLPPTWGGYDPHGGGPGDNGDDDGDGEVFDRVARVLAIVLAVLLLPWVLTVAQALT